MAEAKAEGGDKPAGKKLDLGLILGGVFALLTIAVLGFGVFQTYQATIGYVQPQLREPAALEEVRKQRAEKAQAADALIYNMDTFTVNLSGSPRRIIRLQMALEMLDETGFEEVVRLGPESRDEIVHLLNGKEFEQLETIQGKLFLKDEIMVSLNKLLKNGVIKDIYFSDFVVQ